MKQAHRVLQRIRVGDMRYIKGGDSNKTYAASELSTSELKEIGLEAASALAKGWFPLSNGAVVEDVKKELISRATGRQR